ncbi:MAG: hypothetical protein JO119_16245 [Acidobacteria bacterium]|nr:hypothetical protein [Acidobacteriota bacterium]
MTYPSRRALQRIRGLFPGILGCVALCCSPAVLGQSQTGGAVGADLAQSTAEISDKIDQLTRSLEQTQVELAQSRTEILELRAELKQVLAKMNSGANAGSALSADVQPSDHSSIPAGAPSAQQAPADESKSAPAQITQDDWDILNERVEEQRQVKVESMSRYRVKLSGLALFTAFANFGQVDNPSLPSIALGPLVGYSDGSVGASVRQSIIGLTGYGPTVFGAHTSADLQMDFFGGVPTSYGGNNSGLAELRLARFRMDWKHTSFVAGLDYPFFAPNLPTSYMSVIVPGFASAGKLWSWTPTIRAEHRFDGTFSAFKIEAGFLDPSSYSDNAPNTTVRIPSPTENSRQPTYAARVSASHGSEDRPATIGFGAVYSPQRFVGGYNVSGWAGTMDWRFPLIRRTELSGEFFTGRGIDGFGGLPLSPLKPANAIYYASVTAPQLANIGVIGGWTQFKFRLDSRNEFNVAAGTGGRNSGDLRNAAVTDSFLLSVPARNQMLFANYIFKPRSDLIFSVEYRRLRTYDVTGPADSAGQLGLAVGFLF